MTNTQQLSDRITALEDAVFGKKASASASSTETPLQKAIREAKEKSK